MRRTLLAAGLLLLLTTVPRPAFAQEAAPADAAGSPADAAGSPADGTGSPADGAGAARLPGRLFVHTSPMGARVTLDGQTLERPTPLLLELPAGTYLLLVEKEGYAPLRRRVRLESGKSFVVRQALAGSSVDVSFPAAGEVQVDGEQLTAGGTVFSLEPGTYSLEERGQTAVVTPRAPQQRWIDALHIVFPIFLGFSIFMSVDSAVRAPPGESPFSPAVIATYATTAGLIGLDIGLNAAKRRFERTFSVQAHPRARPLKPGLALYREAEALFAQGSLEEALAACERLPAEAPDSPYLPFALYRRTQILGLLGEPERAAGELEALLRDYPVPDLYDRCLRSLAELSLQAGRYDQALEHLAGLAFVDPEVSREGAAAQRAQILERWAGEDPAVLPRVTEAYGNLAVEYHRSPREPLYRARWAWYLYRSGQQESALAEARKVELRGLEKSDPEAAAEVRRLLEEMGVGAPLPK